MKNLIFDINLHRTIIPTEQVLSRHDVDTHHVDYKLNLNDSMNGNISPFGSMIGNMGTHTREIVRAQIKKHKVDAPDTDRAIQSFYSSRISMLNRHSIQISEHTIRFGWQYLPFPEESNVVSITDILDIKIKPRLYFLSSLIATLKDQSGTIHQIDNLITSDAECARNMIFNLKRLKNTKHDTDKYDIKVLIQLLQQRHSSS